MRQHIYQNTHLKVGVIVLLWLVMSLGMAQTIDTMASTGTGGLA